VTAVGMILEIWRLLGHNFLSIGDYLPVSKALGYRGIHLHQRNHETLKN
jgi:hypothetical protein